MKRTYILIGLIIALSVSVLGQKQKTQPDDVQPRKEKTSKQKGQDKSADGSLLQAGTMLNAELQGVVDVKKSKVGDEVILKTTSAIKQNGEVIVPKGASLVGRITEIKQKTKDNATSRVGMVFDHIRGKNLDMPISASIVSVVTANANAAAGDLFSSDVSGGSTTSGGASTGSRSGGGLLGGVGSTVGGVLNTTTSTVGTVAGTATNTVGQTTGTLGSAVNGLQISSSASGSASSSSTISARDKNVRIEKGATFQMRLDGSVQNN